MNIVNSARRIAPVVSFALSLNSCSAAAQRSLGPVPEGPLMTDATGYVGRRVESSVFQFRFRVITRFQNRGDVPLYLGRCFPNSPTPTFAVEAADGSTTRSAYDQMWACVGHDKQFEVLPGAVRTDTLDIEGPTMVDGYSHLPIGVFEGVFRLHFHVQLVRGDKDQRTLDAVSRSNAFIVRTAK